MKAIIPAAGRGTRFLPYTKAQPKEMIPVVDKPAIQYVVEEAVNGGLRDILIITGQGKRAIEDHFDSNVERLAQPKGPGDLQGLSDLLWLMRRARIAYVRQREPRGLGDAILCAESFVGDEPFAVLLGDDIMMDNIPCIQQLRSSHEEFGVSVIALQEVPRETVPRYAMAIGQVVQPGVVRLQDIIEKPSIGEVRSNLAAIGRYVLTPAAFRHLGKINVGKDGELQLTDAISSLLSEEDVYGLLYNGRRFDVGDKMGWLLANIEFALRRDEFRETILNHLNTYSMKA